MGRMSLFNSPLLLGFEHFERTIDRANRAASDGYPPYNIEANGEDHYRVTIAVAGFSEDALSVEVRENALIVSARKADEDTNRSYLHRGIATRAFERRFHLADHVVVTGASHADGMLHIDLQREVPEALKPRQIEITAATKSIGKDVVDAKSVN